MFLSRMSFKMDERKNSKFSQLLPRSAKNIYTFLNLRHLYKNNVHYKSSRFFPSILGVLLCLHLWSYYILRESLNFFLYKCVLCIFLCSFLNKANHSCWQETKGKNTHTCHQKLSISENSPWIYRESLLSMVSLSTVPGLVRV
jgi:hypothetical protein